MENLQNAGFVRMVSKFVSQDRMGNWLNKIANMMETNGFGQQAGRLLAWAIIIMVICTAIDLIFYWIRPEQQVVLMRNIARGQRFLNKIRTPRR